MFISSLKELRKISGYRQYKDFEILVDVEKCHLGYKLNVELIGKVDEVELFSFPRPGKMLVNNWQSWGPTRVIDKTFSLNFPKELIEKFRFSASIMPEKYFESLISDYFMASDDYLIGALSSKIGHPFFEITGDNISVKLRYFGKKFTDWTKVESFIVLLENPDVAFPYYADLIAKENNVTFNRNNPVGWSSWYQYFLDFDFEKMVINLEKSKTFGYEVFQIDDAWEVDIGDWVPNEKFPSLEKIAAKIREYGYTPGIWLAPFSVSETSYLFKSHPDWVVRDEHGEPVVAYENWNKKIYALDTTNPEAQNWLREIFTNLKKAGFDYFKIDFLFAGAIQGQRFLEVTPVEAYRIGMEIIRKVADNSFVLGCGAPLLPSAGFVDGMRISADTAPYWDITAPDIGYPNAYYALRNVITRSFMNNVLWWNDPDCLILRKEKTQLSDVHRTLYTYVALFLDNMIVQSDELALDIDKKLWNEVLKYKRYGRRKYKVVGLMEGKYKIVSCGLNGCDELLIEDLNEAKFEIKIDELNFEFVKTIEKRQDGRIFNYYKEL
ncbi:MAG: glycoside hydrolase family 36 protein [Fervidobacterium sp.]